MDEGCELCNVGLDGAWVGGEIFRGRKLGRVDKDRDNRIVVLLQARVDQLEMSVVKGAHGGDEADRLAILASLCSPCAIVAHCGKDGDRRVGHRRVGR